MTKHLTCMYWGHMHIHTKYKVSIQNSCHLKTISQNNQKSYQHILGINVAFLYSRTYCRILWA